MLVSKALGVIIDGTGFEPLSVEEDDDDEDAVGFDDPPLFVFVDVGSRVAVAKSEDASGVSEAVAEGRYVVSTVRAGKAETPARR